MFFYEVFKLETSDVVCIAGAGGKTSLLLLLAEELKAGGRKVLVTTTTRMAADEVSDTHDFLVDIKGDKAYAPEMQLLADKVREYDITLIEADGSARKPLKGWRENEPVIPEYATHTIAVVDISTVGSVPDIHNPDIFHKLTGCMGAVTIEALARMINSPEGIFRCSDGTAKILFLNKAESDKDMENARELTNLIRDDVMVTAGSVHNRVVDKLR